MLFLCVCALESISYWCLLIEEKSLNLIAIAFPLIFQYIRVFWKIISGTFKFVHLKGEANQGHFISSVTKECMEIAVHIVKCGHM